MNEPRAQESAIRTSPVGAKGNSLGREPQDQGQIIGSSPGGATGATNSAIRGRREQSTVAPPGLGIFSTAVPGAHAPGYDLSPLHGFPFREAVLDTTDPGCWMLRNRRLDLQMGERIQHRVSRNLHLTRTPLAFPLPEPILDPKTPSTRGSLLCVGSTPVLSVMRC